MCNRPCKYSNTGKSCWCEKNDWVEDLQKDFQNQQNPKKPPKKDKKEGG